jgi:cytochrome c biogenesis factor
MDERKRLRAFVVLVTAVVVIGSLIAIQVISFEADTWATFVAAVILATIALVAVIVTRRQLRDLKAGFPKDDEMSRAIKMRAGYVSFWVSMYFCMVLGWIFGIFVDESAKGFLTMGEMMFVLAGIMGILYIVIWTAVSRGKAVT